MIEKVCAHARSARVDIRAALPNTWRERLEGSLTQLDGLSEYNEARRELLMF